MLLRLFQEVLQASLGGYFRPVCLPAVTTQNIAESQYGINMCISPIHPRAFEARFHHDLVPAFDNPVANWPASGLELGIVHLVFTFL